MRYLWIVCLVFASYAAVAQDCDQTVYDGAGVLNGQEPQIEQAAQGLINHGAVVRVRTVASSQNMDATEKQYEQLCPSWRGAHGIRDSKLIALMVAPKDHKKGLYYGASWHSALDAHWENIVNDHMVPNFRAGNFAQGFIDTVTQVGARVQASADETLHPPPPVDLSGLWRVMMWLLFLSGAAIGAYFMIAAINKRRQIKNELKRVQLSAIQFKNMAAQMVNRKRVTPLSPTDQSTFDSLVEQYSDASGSEKNNPEGDGQTLEMYQMQESLYRGIYEGLRDLGRLDVVTSGYKPSEPKHESRHQSKYSGSQNPTKYSPQSPVQSSEPERIIVHDNSAGFTEGVILGSLLDHDSSRRDEDSNSSSSSWGSSDSGGGGGCGYDSSSDSGGGGGSDFGGGGDSGGGGGGDF